MVITTMSVAVMTTVVGAVATIMTSSIAVVASIAVTAVVPAIAVVVMAIVAVPMPASHDRNRIPARIGGIPTVSPVAAVEVATAICRVSGITIRTMASIVSA